MPAEKRRKRESKKARIVSLWRGGDQDILRIAEAVGSKPSYVAAALQREGIFQHYHDLYTRPESPPNIYSGLFTRRLGFRTLEVAQASVALIDQSYRSLERLRDRAGQHHCMVAALTMYNRAYFSGKFAEAEPFRQWLNSVLNISRAQQLGDRNQRKAG